MPALVIQQDASEKAGLVGRALQTRGFELVPWTVQPDPSQPAGRRDYPDPGDFELVLTLGSPWSVYDPDVAHWVRPQLEVLRRATDAGIPVLGICFGAQALAASLGGEVRPGEWTEVGWQPVSSAETVLAGTWFQWHQDVFEVPAGAEPLATSAVGPQAFRMGRSLAVQFHPEVDSAHLSRWMDSGGQAEVERQGVVVDELLDETRAREAEMAKRVPALVDWFLDR